MLQLIELTSEKKVLLEQSEDLIDIMLEMEFLQLMKNSCGVHMNHEPVEVNIDGGVGHAFPFEDNSSLVIIQGMNQENLDKSVWSES